MAMNLKPPRPKKLSDEDNINAFIKSAEDPYTSGASQVLHQKEELPWKQNNIRRDVKRVFNLRLNEEDFLKIDYISSKTGISKHKICTDIIIPEINKKIKKLLEENDQ